MFGRAHDWNLSGPGGYPLACVGESFCVDALLMLAANWGEDLSTETVELEGIPVHVKPEPRNPYDEHAIGVYDPVTGLLLSHFSREDAARYCARLTELTGRRDRLWCTARFYGSFAHDERPARWLIGMWLNIDEPPWLEAQRRP